MTVFVRGDVVEVAFPGRTAPSDEGGSGDGKETALVVSPSDLEHARGLLWVALVTKEEAPGWDGDVPIVDNAVAGVAPRSVVRTACLATVPAGAAKRIGRVSGPLLGRVLGHITGALGRL